MNKAQRDLEDLFSQTRLRSLSLAMELPGNQDAWKASTRQFAIDYTQRNYDTFLQRLPTRVDTASLPQPNFAFRFIFGSERGETLVKKCITERILMARTVLKRDLSQDETDAFAQHAANYAQFRAWGPILAIAGTAWSWARTRKTFAFTRFYVPKDLSFTKYFPTKKFAFYQGEQAQKLWQVARLTPIGIAWTIGAITLTRLWGNGFTTGRMMQDQRLAGFADEFKAAVSRSRMSGGPGNPDPLEQGAQNGSRPVEYQRRPMPQQQQSQGSSRGYEYDDASPTGGLGGNLDTWQEGGMYSDAQMGKVEQEQTQRSAGKQSQSQSQQSQSAWSRSAQAARNPQQPSNTPRSDADDFLFGSNSNDTNYDDASPTAPAPPPRKTGWLRGNNASTPKPEQTEEAQPADEGVSAWDRVRAQNMSGNGTAGMWGEQRDEDGEGKGEEKKGGWRR